jgi:hypothetical protein
VTYDDGIPDDCRRAVLALVDSLDQLQVLLLLYRARPRAMTIVDVTQADGLAEGASRRELEKMRRLGLATTDGDAYRFESDEVLGAQVAVIARCYGEHRIELINHIASRALKRIQELADAFRVGKGKKDG